MSSTVQTPRDRVISRALPPRNRVFPANSLGVLADACVIGLLGLSMWLIVSAAEQPPILHLNFAIVGVRALAIGRAAFRYAQRLASHDAVLAQLAPLRADTFASLIPRVPGALPTNRRGELLAAYVDDVDQLQDEELRVRGPIVTSAIVVLLSLVVVALISPVAAVVLTVCLVLAGLLAVWLANRTTGAYDRELSEARVALTEALLERNTRPATLAAFDALGQAREAIAQAEQRLSNVQLRRAASAGRTGAILAIGSGVATVAILLLVGPAGQLTAPLMAAVTVLPAAVFEIFAQVPVALVAARSVRASADRIALITEGELPAEIPVEIPAEGADSGQGSALGAGADTTVVLTDLSVRHPGAAAPAVTGVSFTLKPGETLIVTGESGVGKSTLALALVRFLEYGGSFTLGGVEASSLPIDTVRSTIGLCEQRPHLFDSDLRQNLLFAHDSATDDELWAVLERVGLADWARQRDGIDTWLGERGSLISGGQAQRIALARVLLADFPVVVLDEPTAGVDGPLAHKLLQDLLGAVPADRSVLLITHTDVPSSLRGAQLRLG